MGRLPILFGIAAGPDLHHALEPFAFRLVGFELLQEALDLLFGQIALVELLVFLGLFALVVRSIGIGRRLFARLVALLLGLILLFLFGGVLGLLLFLLLLLLGATSPPTLILLVPDLPDSWSCCEIVWASPWPSSLLRFSSISRSGRGAAGSTARSARVVIANRATARSVVVQELLQAFFASFG
ncbi:MAG: hypothetical protein R3E96_07665 [Planctomycetota bacterium]